MLLGVVSSGGTGLTGAIVSETVSGVTYTTTTTGGGFYELKNLPVGSISDLTVSKTGYQTVTYTTYSISAGTGTNVDISLVNLAAIAKIEGIVQNASAASISTQDLKDAGVVISDVISANLSVYRLQIALAANGGLDTTAEIQSMVTAVNTNTIAAGSVTSDTPLVGYDRYAVTGVSLTDSTTLQIYAKLLDGTYVSVPTDDDPASAELSFDQTRPAGAYEFYVQKSSNSSWVTFTINHT